MLPIYAKDEPKYTGTFLLVMIWKIRVPNPEVNKANDMGNPVNMGTNIVAPAITNTCCKPIKQILNLLKSKPP